MKITIIGAGIAGLTFGLACQRAGMDVSIYDQAQALTTIGGGVLLWPHGLRFLEELGLADVLRPAWMSVKSMNIISHQGRRLLHEDHAELYQLLGGEILPIDRSWLQQLLLAQLAPGTLHLGAACIGIEQQPDHARVTFDNGASVCADLVVGADGLHSVVRNAIHPTIKPTYTGFCWWGGIIERSLLPYLPVNEAQFILGQGKMCYLWPIHGDKFMWYLPVKMSHSTFQQATDHAVLLQNLCQGWSEDVQRILAAPQTTQQFHVPIFELAPQTIHSSGRVTLIGDAASASGPLLGQGANRAIEDAYLLVQLLQHQKSSVQQVLSNHDKLRYARHARLFELEHLSADALMHETPEALEYFESQIAYVDLVTMYQDMIPLVSAEACAKLSAATKAPQGVVRLPVNS